MAKSYHLLMIKTKNHQLLASGLTKMGQGIPENTEQQLLEYVALLDKWNDKFNLTAVRDPEQMITQHILDSLSLLPFLTNLRSVLDVGTGAGLPGIPLAIARPDISFNLLDSTRKKINFVQHVVTSLQLPNVEPICARVESLTVPMPIDMVITRAVASLGDFVNLIAGLCTAQTQIVAMKGRKQQALLEAQTLPAGFKLLNIQEVVVPGLDAERCLVFLSKED